MKSVTGYLQTILAWGFVGALIMTMVAPSISRLLISAPVSFGVNCEPAANWSMMALIRSQVIGLVLGAVLGIFSSVYFRLKQKKKAELTASGNSTPLTH